MPQDLSVIGFDDIVLDQFAASTISTVAVSRERLGREAAEMLEARLSGTLDSEPRYLSVELRQRGTSAAPRTHRCHALTIVLTVATFDRVLR